jgi:competence protein ComEC
LIVGTIRSDVEITPRGGIADFRWLDPAGVSRNSRVFLPPAPVVSRGDTIEIEPSVDGPYGEHVFASAVRIVDRAGWIEQQRRSIRSYLSDTIQQYVPGTPGALTLGLLIGDDTALTGAERDDMRRAGLSHLTAVSGWNVTLVIGAVGLVMLKLGLRGLGWSALQLLALAGFVWIVGLEPPVTRAAIMAVAGIIAIRLGRPAHSVTVLVFSAAVMVAVSPEALTSISFQLSVLATLGLVLAGRLTSGYEGWKAVVLTPLAATTCAGLMTAPTLAAEFGTLTLLTVPANLIAGPLVPIASVAGVVVIVLSPIAPLASIAGWFAWLLSGALLWLARQIATVPYAYYSFAPLSATAQAGIYAAMLMMVLVVLPEGRLLARNAANWAQREPFGAIVTAGTACVALLTAALAV